jgi:hypothetical protein
MSKMTKKRAMGNAKTRKNMVSNSGMKNFEREITVHFFEMLLLIKLYHWKTHSYATHKATCCSSIYTTFHSANHATFSETFKNPNFRTFLSAILSAIHAAF